MQKSRVRPGLAWWTLLIACLLVACGDDPAPQGSLDTGAEDTTDDVEDSGVDAADTADGSDTGQDAESDQPEEDVVEDAGPADYTACEGGGSVTVTPAEGGEVVFEIKANVVVAVRVPPGAVEDDTELTVGCVDTAVVPEEGFLTLSRSIEVRFDGSLSRLAEVTIPFESGDMPENAGPQAIRLFMATVSGTPAHSPVGIDLQENMGRGFVTFKTRHPGLYAVSVADDAGEAYQREWVYRAITGVSMGCNGASMIGLRNPDEFDIIGALGGPTDWTYLAHYIEEGTGGFKTAAEGFGSGDPFTPTQELEHAQTFDNFWSPTGEGTGGTFDRPEYIRIFQDLALSFGNLTLYNDESPFLPPGLDPEELLRPASERCPGGEGTTTIETGFYDEEYNPDGTLPVIMFCDGRANRDTSIEFDRYCDLDENGTPDEPNRGLYPGPEDQPMPVVFTWAVDVNGNGVRDVGEPVIRNFHETYEDTGTDGLASADEEGYDVDTNPDPAGDDYDYFLNPTGSENNWRWDEGEAYDDFGLDGVDDTDQLSEGGYDWGEGNGEFDYNPNLGALLEERDQHTMVGQLTQEQWDNLTIYMDAGIRDLFNFGVSTNQLAGAIQAAGGNVRIYDNFFSLANLNPEEDDFRFAEVEYDTLGDHIYLRYGDPLADEEDICWGDGKHVGTVPQIANRLLTLLGLITARFPGGEFTTLEAPFPTPSGDYRYYSEALQAQEQYSIIMPPGYEWRACNDNDDNDRDGLIDGDDPDCEHGMDNSEEPDGGLGVALCSDGIDNDDDQLVDFPEDTDCADADDNSEWPAGHPMRTARFPVVFLLHGYGQTPDDLRAAIVPFAAFMAGGLWQKVIVVYPDGFCGDNDLNQCNDGIDNDDDDDLVDGDDPDCAATGGRGEDADNLRPRCSDGVDNDRDGLIDDADRGCISPDANDESECVKGNFYTNHAAWPDGSSPGPQFEDAFFDLIDHIDDTYRTRPPGTVPAVR